MRKNQVVTVTPVLMKDVSFTDQVESVNTALKSRAAAQREIKLKWADVVQVLIKYEVTPPARRVDAAQAATLGQAIVVRQPKPEVAEELQKIIHLGGAYALNRLAEESDVARLLEKKFPGLYGFLADVIEAKRRLSEPPAIDEDKTKAARAELKHAVNAYIQALEEFDETVESISGVKEYIGIMKDIAGISAIAQGAKAKE